VFLRDIVGDVEVKVLYRPDFYPCWLPWITFTVCADTTPTDSHPGYRTRIGLGDIPTTDCETANDRQLQVGHFFQIRVEITGYCKFMGARFAATSMPEAEFAPPICSPSCGPELPIP
jgi:hypothetical protein